MGSITGTHEVKIIDIRIAKTGFESALRDDILSGLHGAPGLKTLPTLLLYNEPGLKIFEDITYLEEYYLTNTEIGILTQYADSIAERIEDGGIIVELGSGNLRKVEILLDALDRLGKRITYYALDLDRTELMRTLLAVPKGRFQNIHCVGLHGTYDDGRAWLQKSTAASRCVLWLGSSAGNFSLEGVAAFLRTWAAEALREGSRDSMLVGLDGCKDGEKVLLAYNDPQGLTRDFILNGLWNANAVLGAPHFVPGEWGYVGEWNAEEGRHQAYYEALRDIVFTGELAGATVAKGERINVEYSYKFDASESRMLWSQSGLMEGAQWGNSDGDYYVWSGNEVLHMLYKPAFFFPLGPPSTYAPEPAPTLPEWRELWAAWDAVTLGMIPRHTLLSQPIDLRNPCIFYLGHIPTFLDMHIARATGTALTAPSESYLDIFQRGIDPDVDDPQQCHAHSSTPDVWPPLDDIVRYAGAVRARVAALYNPAGSVAHTPLPLQRALWLAFEHEAMHLETLLYMLLQSSSALPPPGVTAPDFTADHTTTTSTTTTATSWVEIPELQVTIGTDEPRYFGWDNEKPSRTAVIAPFKISPHPITNAEYARFIYATSGALPASWITASTPCAGPSLDDFLAAHCVKTLFGPVPLTLAGDWPVMASYDELAGCAEWAGGRIPSAEEMHAVYTYVESIEAAEKTLAKRIDAVNGHLVNNGVCESPPSAAAFADLRGRNVGFKNWHPTSVRGGGYTALGRGAAGGAWEWTSTVLTRHKGFSPEPAYPEYTTDFFDGKHNIVLGGSWATHPRIAGRRSFVNWYQRGYRYAWATARIVAVEKTT